jgi:hypothetical protein
MRSSVIARALRANWPTNYVQASNSLLLMAGTMLSILTGNRAVSSAVQRLQTEFGDCLSPLVGAVKQPG